MATLSANALNLVDIAKRLDPDGKAARIAELLEQTNGVLADIPWVEGNLPTGHRITVRTGLPTTAWRQFNAGTQPTKSTTAQIEEGIGMLEAWSEVDKDIAELNGNVGPTRAMEAKSFIEAMGQEFAQTLFYGNSAVDTEEFTGFAPRYNSLSATNAQNILDAGGTGSDNSSIWLVGWADDKVCGIFPKGSMAGLQHEDRGLETVEAVAGIAGSRLLAYRERFQWKGGLAVKDWRYVARVANIDISELTAKTASAADLFDFMIGAIHRIINLNAVRPAFYMNRTVFQMLDIQARDDMVGSALRYSEVAGRMVPSFRGIPVRLVDQLTETEAQIT
jgi:hypothetical protein